MGCPMPSFLAGPDQRTGDSAPCATCGNRSMGDEPGAPPETDPCQGSDDCTARVCYACRVECSDCGLYACAEHIVEFGGEKVCAICMAGFAADGGE